MAIAKRAEAGLLAGAVIVGVIASLTFALSVREHAAIAPILLALPLAGVLLFLGRLRWLGAIYLIASIGAAYFLSVGAAILVFNWLDIGMCLFCSPEDAAEHFRRTLLPQQLVGATGGLVGGLLSYLALMPLGARLRDRRALTLMGVALPLLALCGAVGFTGALPGMTTRLIDPAAPNAAMLQTMLFIGPWQLIFGATLAGLLLRHTPKPRASPPPPHQT